MPRKLQGTIEYRNGRWTVRIRNRYIGTYDTEAQAEKARAAAVRITTERAKAPMTLARFGKKWLDQREIDGVAGIKQERSNWAVHIAGHLIATLPLRSVRPKHLANFASELATKPATRAVRRKEDREWVVTHTETGEQLSRATATRILKLVYLAFEGARIAGHIRHNPAEGISAPRMRRRTVASHTQIVESPEIVQFLSKPEIDRVLALLDGEPMWRSLYAVAIYGGLRKGELVALRWEDIDLDGEHPRIRVRRSNSFRGLKSAAGMRDVPLFWGAMEALRRWRGHGGVRREFGPVWPTADGSMRRPGDDLRWPDKRDRRGGQLHVQPRVRTLAKVRPEIRFHDLRHTCASHLIQGTWTARPLSLEEIRDWLGHSHVSVTERYSHLGAESIRSHSRSNDPAGEKEE